MDHNIATWPREQQPYASWTLADTWLWLALIVYPDNGNMYSWDEDVYQADNTKGWVEVE